MERGKRLAGRRRFSEVYSQGQIWANRLVVLRGLPNGLEVSRFGLAVGKRLGKAVVRNRLRRRLWGCLRQTPVRGGRDLILVARSGVVAADYNSLQGAVKDVLHRSRLMEEEP